MILTRHRWLKHSDIRRVTRLPDTTAARGCRYVTTGSLRFVALTNAQRQRAHRERRAASLDALERENGELRLALADARQDLEDVLAENDRLSERGAAAFAAPSEACRHPAESVDGGTCRACGADI